MPQTDERNKVLDDAMQRALKKVQSENPGTKQVTVSPSTSSPITSLMMPRGSMAVTNPFTGNITYNPDMMQGQSPTDMEQTLQHELTHVKQTQDTPWWKVAASLFTPDEKVPAGVPTNSPLNDPYQWRPREMEAFQSERDRAGRVGISGYADPVTGSRDLQLPRERGGIKTGPSSGKLKQLTGE
jgi:hypothetical protein